MSDEELRELERRWRETGAEADEAAFLLARVRTGALSREELRLRAYRGEGGATLAFRHDPRPRRLDPAPALADALARFEGAGGVVEHFFFEPPGDAEIAHAHELIAREAAALFAANPAHDNPAMSGHSVSIADFLGGRFDGPRLCLLFPTFGSRLLPAAEAVEARQRHSGWSASITGGYAYAYSEPPYGLRLDLLAIQALFDEIWNAAFGGWDGANRIIVFEWSTEHLPGFEAGRDWWGSFLWTVARHDGGPWVAVAASETD